DEVVAEELLPPRLLAAARRGVERLRRGFVLRGSGASIGGRIGPRAGGGRGKDDGCGFRRGALRRELTRGDLAQRWGLLPLKARLLVLDVDRDVVGASVLRNRLALRLDFLEGFVVGDPRGLALADACISGRASDSELRVAVVVALGFDLLDFFGRGIG